MELRKVIPAAWVGCLFAWLLCGEANADPIKLQLAPGETIRDFFYPPDEIHGQVNQTGVTVANLSSQTGDFSAEYSYDSPLKPGDKVVGGFLLLDGSMSVNSSIAQGRMRVGYRMGFAGRAIRRLGGNPATVRMMRFDARARTWRRATDLLRADVRAGRVKADIRRIRGKDMDFVLGHHGFSADQQYVWSVLDRTSLYAVGFQPIPEPGAIWLCAAAGLLFAVRRIRRKRS